MTATMANSSPRVAPNEVVMLKVETLSSERRKPSSISFEKHNLFIVDRLDDDFFSDDEDDTPNDDNDIRDATADKKECQHNTEWTSIDSNGKRQKDKSTLPFDGNIEAPSRRVNDCKSDAPIDLDDSIDLNDLAPLEDAERRSQGSKSSGSSIKLRSSLSVVGRIEDEIIAKAIDEGKITMQNRGHRSWSPGSGGGGFLPSSSSSSSSRHHVSFAAFPSGGRNRWDDMVLPRAGRMAPSRSSSDDGDDEDKNEEQHGGIISPIIAEAAAAGIGGRAKPEVVSVRSPPPRGAMPSRSSFKRRRPKLVNHRPPSA